MKPKATHTTFRTGKRIHVIMRNGETFIDKFIESKSGRLIFETRAVRTSEVRSATIERGKVS